MGHAATTYHLPATWDISLTGFIFNGQGEFGVGVPTSLVDEGVAALYDAADDSGRPATWPTSLSTEGGAGLTSAVIADIHPEGTQELADELA